MQQLAAEDLRLDLHKLVFYNVRCKKNVVFVRLVVFSENSDMDFYNSTGINEF